LANPIGDYFNLVVDSAHATGDIWADLPCLGLLGVTPIRGLVISPACDLSNRKAEMITYLPILPLRRFFQSYAFARDVIAKLNSFLNELKLESLDAGSFLGGNNAQIQALEAKISDLKDNATERAKISAAVRLLHGDSDQDSDMTDARMLFGRDFERISEKIVRNALRPDVHFVPSDGYKPEISAVPEHSVVMFRYPITVPIAVLDAAQGDRELEWSDTCEEIARIFPIALSFSSHRPEKRARIEDRYMADLLTRYLSLYMRLGSPDFPEGIVAMLSQEIAPPDV
jgi:hypothetical protein